MINHRSSNRMAIQIPELERIPAEQRQSVLEEAVRMVNATHGKTTTPAFVGCGLAAAMVVTLAVMNKGPLLAVMAALPAYAAGMLIGVAWWRRSMVREVRAVVSRIIVDRAQDVD